MASEEENAGVFPRRKLFRLTGVERDPIRFEPYSLLSELGYRNRVSIRDGRLQEELLVSARKSIESALANDAFLYGQLAQSMFEAMVVALGTVKLIKQEDAGAVYGSVPDLKIPDFRIVRADGSPILVEVKNFNQENPQEPFSQEVGYVKGLEDYTALNNCELWFAIYWVKWNYWTIVPSAGLVAKDGIRTITFGEAVKANCSAAIGDVAIATCSPLRLVLRTDPSPPTSISEDGAERKHLIRISAVEHYSGDHLVRDPLGRKLVEFFWQYGKWQPQPELAILEGDLLTAIEFQWVPEEPTGQGFEFVGNLSSMFSSWFRSRVIDGAGNLSRGKIDISPGFLSALVPENCSETDVPLWVFVQQPS